MKTPVIIAILFLAFGVSAQTANRLSSAEIQGRQLASQELAEMPVTNFTQRGVLRIRHEGNPTIEIPITFVTETGAGKWSVLYNAAPIGRPSETLVIVHQDGLPNGYYFSTNANETVGQIKSTPGLDPKQIMAPFAGSDFWIADLGLEFFHWPGQKVTGHESRRMRDCTVLESDNPNPSVGYSRVVSWLDNQTLGIIHAEAYDAKNKLLKMFNPKSLKKVNGQWELQDVEIQNVQTHSRTWIRFDLEPAQR